MFLHLFVCLSLPIMSLPISGHMFFLGVSLSRGVFVRRGSLCQETPPIEWPSRHYASYWNTVLLFVILPDISNVIRLQFQSISLINFIILTPGRKFSKLGFFPNISVNSDYTLQSWSMRNYTWKQNK